LANINDFWELFKVAGGGTSSDLTRVLTAIVKSDRSKIDTYFSNVIDQVAFDTEDWRRLREFLIDLFASHRAISTQGSKISDPSNLSNDELDELFRSFGYPESSQLRAYDNNPLPSKILLFLTLVDLYKIKGTPQSILDILKFYGITQLDIYEFWLEKLREDKLHFKGDVITGTSLNPDSLSLNYDLLTGGDPHWLYTEQQILNLDKINDINLPSKTPYFAVQPIVEFGSESSVTVRIVQDQFESWKNTGILPEQNAEVVILGEVVSFLELYLASIYEFQKLWTVGYKGDRFVCYDGSSTNTSIITSEYESIIAPPITRDNIPIKLLKYYDLFTRETPRNFLQNKNDAEYFLNLINPSFKSALDSLPDSTNIILQSLLKDLGVWLRNNIGFGFVNAGYLTFGLKYLFEDLKPVIDFFKPYRARLILLEKLKFDTRLFHAVRVEDRFGAFTNNMEIHDYVTADSLPCCDNDFEVDATSSLTICAENGVTLPLCEKKFYDSKTGVTWKGLWQTETAYSVDDVITGASADYICILNHTSSTTTKPTTGAGWSTYWKKFSELVCIDSTGNTFYSRETYDCGSYFDIGAATDLRRIGHEHDNEEFEPVENDVHINIESSIHDRLRCYHCTDSTGCVELGCSDCINDGYCRWLDYDCLRVPIDSDGYVTSETKGEPPYFIDDTSVTTVFDSTAFSYFQSGGFADFDDGGMFDCTHGFDLVQITIEEGLEGFLLTEDGGYLLQENGGRIYLEDNNSP